MNEVPGVERGACPLCGAGLEPDQSVCPRCGRIVRRDRGSEFSQPRPSESSQPRLAAPFARGIAGVLGLTFVAMALGSLVNGTDGATAPDQGTLKVLLLILGLDLSWGAVSGRRAFLVLGLLLFVPTVIVGMSVLASTAS
jgi:hypothetical protein